MDIGIMLKSLQDPLGLPFYPVVFQILMVVMFGFHILFINFAVGASFLAFFGFLKRGDDRWKMLSGAMSKAATANISIGVLLGVAPLLFVQTIYDPMWYSSNMIFASWVIAFVLILIIGYSLTYVFYFRSGKSKGGSIALVGMLAFALIVLAGIIMHVLGYMSLQPEKWLSWYASGGNVDTSGNTIHTFQLSRFLHFMAPSLAMAGILLMLYGWYFKGREDMDGAYLQWAAKLGANLALIFTIIQMAVGLWWLFSIPAGFKFYYNPFFIVSAVLALGFLVHLIIARKYPFKYAVRIAVWALLTILSMSFAREALRMAYLKPYGYSIFDYKLNIDWGSTILFFATFLIGSSIAAYFIAIVYQAGRLKGKYTASPVMEKWGKLCILLLVLWILFVAGYGIGLLVKLYL